MTQREDTGARGGTMMGICVGTSCIGVAVVGAAWNGTWRHAQTRHADNFPSGADHVQRVDCALRASSEVTQWARSRAADHVWLVAPEPDATTSAHSEISAVLVTELMRAGIEVVSVRLEASGGGVAAQELQARLLEQGAPDGLCGVEYVALGMLGLARQQRMLEAGRLQAARDSMPREVAHILNRIAR